MNLEDIKQKLVLWAEQKSFVKKLWIYGSRSSNDFRADSDLDIAIEIDGLRDETPYTSFFFEHKKWNEELNRIFPYKLHLAHYNPDVSNDLPPEEGNVVKSVSQSNILVYTRSDVLK